MSENAVSVPEKRRMNEPQTGGNYPVDSTDRNETTKLAIPAYNGVWAANGGLIAQYDMNDLPEDWTLFPYERNYASKFFGYPEVAAVAASRQPPLLPISLVNEVFASVLFTWVPEEVFIQINPLSFGYLPGTFNDLPEKHCQFIHVYSDQSQLQYIYNAHKCEGVVYFSLVVARFADLRDDDHSDPNRARFLEYLFDPNIWSTIMAWEAGYGYFVFDFKTLPRPITEEDIPPEQQYNIKHITAHVNQYLGREPRQEVSIFRNENAKYLS